MRLNLSLPTSTTPRPRVKTASRSPLKIFQTVGTGNAHAASTKRMRRAMPFNGVGIFYSNGFKSRLPLSFSFATVGRGLNKTFPVPLTRFSLRFGEERYPSADISSCAPHATSRIYPLNSRMTCHFASQLRYHNCIA